jgi:hypothetical protein
LKRRLELGATDEGPSESQLIGIVEITADWQTRGETSDPDTKRFELTSEIHRSGVTFDGGVGGNDKFGHAFWFQTLAQLLESELTRTDSVDG